MRPFLPFATLLGMAFLLGCQEQGSGPVGPEVAGPQFHEAHDSCTGHKKNDPGCNDTGTGKGDKPTWTSARVALHSGDTPQAAPLITTCDVVSGGDKPSLSWPRHDMCANITVAPSVTLTDDPYLAIKMKAGKIYSVQFHEQDVIGGIGIQFESEVVVLVTPQEFTGAGFTLHIDTDNIPVYQLSGHTSGRRVAQVGLMYLGDVVYQ